MEPSVAIIPTHSTGTSLYLRYLSVSEETKSEFSDVFAQGLPPSTALAEVKRSIKEQLAQDNC